ncbi:MAG: hypothetical protein HYU60_07710 [Magnetospirillum sp.]|nr:hypothetical protein [Magnetospirillum sp.]
MSLFGRRKGCDEVRAGDVFRKAGTYGGEWVVERLFEYPDIPPHARLIERTGSRTMTVAVSLLLDLDSFTSVQQAASQD